VSGTATLRLLQGVLSGAPRDHLEGDQVFRDLLHGIVSLELAPSAMLTERELMERTGCSRAALRTAVNRLAELGLITPLARKGLVVAALDVLEISAVYDARLAIEAALARLAAARATPEQVDALRRIGDHEPAAHADAFAFVERDLALHLSIARVARNHYLEDCLTRVLPLSARLWHLLFRELGADRTLMFEHGSIIDAIARRDPDAAEAAVREHLGVARRTLASALVPVPEASAP
jgi:DNA-binding GntR family transcriptional regulator